MATSAYYSRITANVLIPLKYYHCDAASIELLIPNEYWSNEYFKINTFKLNKHC